MGVTDYNLVLEIQQGGSGAGDYGYAYESKELSGLKLGAPTGGEITWKRYYGTDYGRNAYQVPIGRRRTGNPTPYKLPLSIPNWVTPTVRNLLRNMEGVKNIRVRAYNGDVNNRNGYQVMYGWINAVNTNLPGAFDGDIMNGAEPPADLTSRQWPQEADAYAEWWPVSHVRIAPTLTTLAINAAISYGFPRNAGDIVGEVGNNDGGQEFIAVTGVDGSNLSHILWTQDGGTTWTDVTITGMTNFAGSGVAMVGENLVISGTSTGGGLVWAKWADVKAGTATFARSTNISAGTVLNAVAKVTGQKALASGASGAVYVSTDGGKTFTSAGTAVTANTLTWIAVYDDTLQYMGGASGALVRRKNDVMSLMTAGGWSTTALTAGAVPNDPSRSVQLFVGTAAGDIYFCQDATASVPVWTKRYSAGSGSIPAMAFAGYCGNTFWFVWTNGSTQSVVRRDFTGGYFGQVEDIGSVTSPGNSGINAIAVPNSWEVNKALVVGPVNTSNGYIGLIN